MINLILKRLLRGALVAVVVVFAMTFFVACKKDNTGSDVGVVYSVTFDLAGGKGEIEDQSVEDGKKATDVGIPVRAGYEFLGWYNGEELWDFTSSVVDSNISLVAKWEKNEEDWVASAGLNFENIGGGFAKVSGYNGTDAVVDIPNMVDILGTELEVLVLGDGVFKDKTAITKVNLPKSLSVIGNECFSGSGLQEIYIPSGVTSIGNSAFYGISSLKTIKFDNACSVVTIGEEVFVGTGLKSLIMPDSVETIGRAAFKDTGLASVLFGDRSNLKSIGAEAFLGTMIELLDLPEGLTTINNAAFKGCTALESVVLPSTFSVAGDDIFYGTMLDRVYVRSGVQLNKANFSSNWNRVYANSLSEYIYYSKNNHVAGSWRYINGLPVEWEQVEEVKVVLPEELKTAGYNVTLFAYTFDGKYEHKFALEENNGVFSAEIDILDYSGYRVGLFEDGDNPYNILEARKQSVWYDHSQINIDFEALN